MVKTLPPVTDIHAHWLPHSALEACEANTSWHGLEMSRTPEGLPVAAGDGRRTVFGSDVHFDGLAARAERLDADGVDVQVLSLLPPLWRYERKDRDGAAACRDENDELAAEIAAAPPGRFLGLGVVPLQAIDATVAELQRCVQDLGLVGIAVGTNIQGSRWENPRLWDVLEAASDLGAVVFIHPSAPEGFPLPSGYYLHNVFGNPADTTLALQRLIFSGAVERFPDLKLVAAHGGGYTPFSLERMDHAWNVRPETSVDTSMTPSEAMRHVCVDTVLHSPAAARFVVDVLGSDRVVLGTDFPADMGLPKPVSFLEDALAAEDVNGVLRSNMQRLLAAK